MKRSELILAAFLATGLASAAQAEISACVNQYSGQLRIVTPDTACGPGYYFLEWNEEGPPGPPGPQGQPGSGGGGGGLNVQYVTGTIVPGTSVARAFCPTGMKVIGGGGLTAGAGSGLQQSFPISDPTGLIAWGSNGIGWQAAADDWGFVQAFAICAGP